jgi:hypothetical protein
MRKLRFYADASSAVWSRHDTERAFRFIGPVLDYASMTPANAFTPTYTLERVAFDAHALRTIRPVSARRVAVSLRNLHRAAWHLPTLPCVDPAQVTLWT